MMLPLLKPSPPLPHSRVPHMGNLRVGPHAWVRILLQSLTLCTITVLHALACSSCSLAWVLASLLLLI